VHFKRVSFSSTLKVRDNPQSSIKTKVTRSLLVALGTFEFQIPQIDFQTVDHAEGYASLVEEGLSVTSVLQPTTNEPAEAGERERPA
jgi:hypothetical protein